MDLEILFYKVNDILSTLDFNKIWPGFKLLKFALYDNEKCFFDGKYIEKTNEFCANTSILFNGEHIAIWMVNEELDIHILASKIVHEMFHGYQKIMEWDSFPNEFEALYNYKYSKENIGLNMYENELMVDDYIDLNELLSLRKLRSIKYKYEFLYESSIEEIEGSATFVEWQVLKQLDTNKAKVFEDNMKAFILNPKNLFPIRISCYYKGALLIDILNKRKLYQFDIKIRPFIMNLIDNVNEYDINLDMPLLMNKVSNEVIIYNEKTKSIVEKAINENNIVLKGDYELKGVNFYNARFHNGYIISTFFMMYLENKENKILYGNFVIKMKDDKNIELVYKLENSSNN